jgi:hypothetical protein
MGNIVTTNTGTLPDKISSTSFAKIINDSLLELDLYSVDPTTGAPRVANNKGIFEVDYTNTGIASRPKNTAGQFVDTKGLPYTMDTDSSSVVNSTQIYNQIEPSQSKYWKNISKYYNFKRGVCNATNRVPVNIAGVNFPQDWNSANPSEQTKKIQSCLITGDENGPTSITAGNSDFNIPDINLSTDTLNIGPNGLTNQTVYGKPMTPTCSQLVNSLLTNSYVLTDINNYTKLSSIKDSTITSSNFDIGKNIFLNYNSNDDKLQFTTDTNLSGSTYGTSSVSVPIAGNENKNTEIKNAHLRVECNDFYTELCNYYYYNDLIDGIQYNPNLLNSLTTSNKLLFGNNMNYVTEHIPDCRCVNNLSVRDALVEVPSGAENAIEYYYVANKCNSRTGISTQYGENPGSTVVNIPQIVGNILNPYLSSNSYRPFGNQIDPVDPNRTSSATEMVDGTFLFAQQAREIVNTFNNYICNMTQTINASNNGAVTIAGISMACNIGGDAPTTTPGSPPPPSSNNVSGNTYTFSVSIKDSLLNDYTDPVNPLTPLDAILTFDNQAYKFYNSNNNTPLYKFVFAPVNSTSKSPTVTAKFGCGHDSAHNPYPASSTTCNNQTSFTIYSPFLYGTTTYEFGIDYYLVLQWGGVSNFINPSVPIPILLKQYAMQIVDVIPGKDNSVNPSIFYLQFNIKFNCISTPIVPYAIVLTPKNSANSTITITGTDFFSDVSNNKGSPNKIPYNYVNNRLADGSLTVGTSSVNVIQPDSYTYEILLNPDDTNTIGTPMNYNNTVFYKSTFDFTKLVSGFNNTTISYLDYNNNNQITLFSSTNAIANFGSTIVLNWSFVNAPGDNFKYFNIYYTVGSEPTSSANTTNALCQLNTYSIKNTSYQFMIPPFAIGQKIYFNIEAAGSTSNIKPVFSNSLILTSTPAPTIFNGWNIIPTTTSAVTDEINISDFGGDLAYLNSSSTIYDYLAHYDLSGMSGANAYVYDFTQKVVGNNIGGWFAAVFTPPSTSTSGPASVVVFQPLANNTLNFILNDSSDNVIVSTNSQPSSPPTIQIGALISIAWTLGTSLKSDVQAQLYLYGILYQTFVIPKGTTTGNFKFTLYDLTGAVTNTPNVSMYITISNVIKSPQIKLNINNPFISTKPTPSPISLSPTNPLAYINSDGTRIIKSVNVTLTNSLDNIFYNVFSGYNSPLIVNTHIITLKNINYSQPVKINVTNSSTSHFTNVYGKIRDSKKEHFDNITISPKNNKNKLIEGFVSNPSTSELIVNVLRLDLSQSPGFSKSVLVNYIFNNYRKVTIQSLELFFGTTNVDNSTFNISFIGQQVGTNKVINDSYKIDVNISTVRIIGIMTSQVFFPVTIPGATVVNYSPNTLTNGGWANTFVLDNHNNGYYSINSSDSSAVTTANNVALNITSGGGGSNAIVNRTPGAAPESSSGSNMLLYYGIGSIILILIGVGVYYMFFNKAKK